MVPPRRLLEKNLLAFCILPAGVLFRLMGQGHAIRLRSARHSRMRGRWLGALICLICCESQRRGSLAQALAAELLLPEDGARATAGAAACKAGADRAAASFVQTRIVSDWAEADWMPGAALRPFWAKLLFCAFQLFRDFTPQNAHACKPAALQALAGHICMQLPNVPCQSRTILWAVNTPSHPAPQT